MSSYELVIITPLGPGSYSTTVHILAQATDADSLSTTLDEVKAGLAAGNPMFTSGAGFLYEWNDDGTGRILFTASTPANIQPDPPPPTNKPMPTPQ